MFQKLLNPEGLPWTAGIGLPLTIVLIIFTGGTFAVLLGAYLAYWLWVRHQSTPSLFYYSVLIGLGSLHVLPAHIFTERFWSVIDLAIVIVWIVAEFVLRQEIIVAYREHEGYELAIRRLWTFFFGSLYLNYCIPPYAPRQRTT
jgi:hypothetical protein